MIYQKFFSGSFCGGIVFISNIFRHIDYTTQVLFGQGVFLFFSKISIFL